MIDFMGMNRWLVKIIVIHNGQIDGVWRAWTRVEHRAGGTVIKRERYEPAEGWGPYLHRRRHERPELERHWAGPP